VTELKNIIFNVSIAISDLLDRYIVLHDNLFKTQATFVGLIKNIFGFTIDYDDMEKSTGNLLFDFRKKQTEVLNISSTCSLNSELRDYYESIAVYQECGQRLNILTDILFKPQNSKSYAKNGGASYSLESRILMLMIMAACDDDIDENERQLIEKKAIRFGISLDRLEELWRLYSINCYFDETIPKTQKERMYILAEMTAMMMVDGIINKEELRLLKNTAKLFEIPVGIIKVMIELIEPYVNQTNDLDDLLKIFVDELSRKGLIK